MTLARDTEAGAICLRCGTTGKSEWRFESSAKSTGPKPPPKHSKFPSRLQRFEYRPSPDGVDANLLVFFHGLGDSPAPFIKLGEQFALPQTALLALRAPSELPLELGSSWYDVIDTEKGDFIEIRRGERRRVQSLSKCFEDLDQALAVILECGWLPHEVFLFGFSQGGTVAMEWALHHRQPSFGGIVAVAAGLMEERQWPTNWPPSKRKEAPSKNAKTSLASLGSTGKSPGDCLILAGRQDTTVLPKWASKSAKLFSDPTNWVNGDDKRAGTLNMKTAPKAEVVFFEKAHGMLASPEEAIAVMTFLAPRLRKISAWEQDPDVYLVGSKETGGATVEGP